MTIPSVKRVGLVGLGKMGRPMGRHLKARGFAVTGCDVSAEAVAQARALGLGIAGSPAEVAGRSDLVIIVVGFEAEVEEALFAPEGVLAGARPGLVVAISSTVAPAFMAELAGRVEGSGVVLLDTPLCRGEQPAEDGRLLVMGGGDPAVFEACRPAFASFSDAIHHLGGLGAGQIGKMVNNLILWACIAANDEGLRLARALGVAEEPLRLALMESSARNFALDTWRRPRPMPWAEKDMTIVLQEADDIRLSLPLCGALKEVIKGIKIDRGLAMPKAAKRRKGEGR